MASIDKCPAREVELQPYERWIDDSKVPEECISCMVRAIHLQKTAEVTTVNSRDATISRLKALDRDFNPDDEDMWESTTLKRLDESKVRVAEIANGYDFGGQSYDGGTETGITTVRFECYE